MAIEIAEVSIRRQLDDLVFDIETLDMDKVKKETLRGIASVAASFVREAVVASPEINAPATEGPYESGPGPSMASKEAWVVDEISDSHFQVRPHPLVRQRAIVLNDGYSGRIEPKQADALRFTVNGVPRFAAWVEGPDAAGYWEAAFRRLEHSGEFERIGMRELRKEIRGYGL